MSWAIGAFSVAMMVAAYSNLALYYFVVIAKLDPGVAATAVFAARMCDLLIAPAVGTISDTTRTRWGRRRPFLLAGAILAPIACVMIFSTPPTPTGAVAVIYVFVALLTFTLAYTLYSIPHTAMANDMTQVPSERVGLMAKRLVFNTLGSLAGAAGLPLVLQRFGDDSRGYGAVAGLLAGACLVSMAISFFGTRHAPFVAEPVQRVRLKDLGAGMLRDRPFMAFSVGKFISLCLASAQAPALIFFLRGVLKLPLSALSVYFLLSSVAGLASAPLWPIVVRRLGKMGACNLTFAIGLVVSLSWLIARPGDGMIPIAIRGVLFGLVVGGFFLVSMSMQADIIEHDYLTTRRRREGLYSAVFSFTDKSAAALGVLMVGLILASLGFDKSLAPTVSQSPMVTLGLYVAVGGLPAVGFIAAYLIFRGYRLEDVHLQSARDASAAAPIPEGDRP